MLGLYCSDFRGCIEQVTSMEKMFEDASSFNQDINSWNTAQVGTENVVLTYGGAYGSKFGRATRPPMHNGIYRIRAARGSIFVHGSSGFKEQFAKVRGAHCDAQDFTWSRPRMFWGPQASKRAHTCNLFVLAASIRSNPLGFSRLSWIG